MLLQRVFFKFATKILRGHGLGKISALSKIYGRIGKKVFGEYILYDGQKIFLDTEGAVHLALYTSESEAFELSLFKSLIKSGNVVLDVGANIGFYTLVAAKSVGKGGVVYSFEPDPVAFADLQKNIIENSHTNVIVVNKAVSSKTGIAELVLFSSNSVESANYIIADETHVEGAVKIETIALDDFFADGVKKVSVIKIDIEGAEFEAIKGMKNLIERNESLALFVEFNPFALKRAAVSIPEFIDYLISFNFIIYNIDEKNKEVRSVHKNWLLEFATDNSSHGYTNLLCMKGSPRGMFALNPLKANH